MKWRFIKFSLILFCQNLFKCLSIYLFVKIVMKVQESNNLEQDEVILHKAFHNE